MLTYPENRLPLLGVFFCFRPCSGPVKLLPVHCAVTKEPEAVAGAFFFGRRNGQGNGKMNDSKVTGKVESAVAHDDNFVKLRIKVPVNQGFQVMPEGYLPGKSVTVLVPTGVNIPSINADVVATGRVIPVERLTREQGNYNQQYNRNGNGQQQRTFPDQIFLAESVELVGAMAKASPAQVAKS